MKLQRKTKSYEIDMCNGPIFTKLVAFAVPLILSGILQLLFNAADIIVVGRFAGNEALAAVGSTSALINLLVNVFIGLSVGANVLVARYFGARQQQDLEETVHTSMVMSGVGGILLMIVGVTLANPLLQLMGTPYDVLPLAVLYMKIFFLGMPMNLIYNFGSAVLRAVGDTERPLYFLLLAGIINVILNLFFVILFSLGVAGVALATTISQCISAYFSVSNVQIQSAVNSFGSIAVAGNTAAYNIEGFIYTAMNAVYQTALSFTSQNFGAKKYSRMKKILTYCMLLTAIVGLAMGSGAVLCGKQLLGIYSSDSQVIQYGMNRLRIIGSTYFICGLMDCIVGGLRGMGYSVMPMVVSLTGACAFRVVWVLTIFAMNRTLPTLYTSYPVSWAITLTAHLVCYALVIKNVKRQTIIG